MPGIFVFIKPVYWIPCLYYISGELYNFFSDDPPHYIFDTRQMTWYAAEKECQKGNRHLVRVDTKAENDYLVGALRQR